MKRLFLSLLPIIAAISCSRDTIKTGDLLFIGIPADYSAEGSMTDAIGEATSKGEPLNIIHTAILEARGDSIWVIDATLKHGVDRHPLDTLIADFKLRGGASPSFIIKRLRDTTGVAQFVRNAKTFIGLRYNNSFVPCDTARYCTELVRDSYITPDGQHIFSEAPMNFLAPDGTMPGYWEWLFAQLGIPVPQGVAGTNPRGMMEEECLVDVKAKLLP